MSPQDMWKIEAPKYGYTQTKKHAQEKNIDSPIM